MTTAKQFDNRLLGLGGLSESTNGLPLNTATDQLVAHAGGTQAAGLQLNSEINRVVTVATANDSVVLPQAAAGLSVQVTNAAASNSMNVFPFLGDAINAGATNAAFAIVAGKTAMFFSAAPGIWHTILSA